VALSETYLTSANGEARDFPTVAFGMELEDIINLTVGQLSHIGPMGPIETSGGIERLAHADPRYLGFRRSHPGCTDC